MKITKVRGTEDKLDLTLQTFVLNKIRNELSKHNFNEIETPIIEPEALFYRSLGKETDVVSKEMFHVVASGDEKICLRPEATASTTRAFIENGIQDIPWNVFSTGPMFRHERPQKGRWRQFEQFNIESVGSQSIAHDANILSMIDKIFSNTLKLQDYTLSINFLGNLEERKKFRRKLVTFLTKYENKICETCKERTKKNPLRVLDCKSPTCQKVYDDAPMLMESLEAESKQKYDKLKELLHLLSVTFIENPRLVRGLDYYEDLVFEFSSPLLGSQDAFCGGGRYELASMLGANNPVPSLGAAIGIGRLLMLVEYIRSTLAVPQKPILHIVLPIDEKQQGIALVLAERLRQNGKCVQTLLDQKKVQKMMRKANKLGARTVLIIGETEQNEGTVTVKDMISGNEQKIGQDEAHSILP